LPEYLTQQYHWSPHWQRFERFPHVETGNAGLDCIVLFNPPALKELCARVLACRPKGHARAWAQASKRNKGFA